MRAIAEQGRPHDYTNDYAATQRWDECIQPGAEMNNPVSYTHLTLPTILRV